VRRCTEPTDSVPTPFSTLSSSAEPAHSESPRSPSLVSAVAVFVDVSLFYSVTFFSLCGTLFANGRCDNANLISPT